MKKSTKKVVNFILATILFSGCLFASSCKNPFSSEPEPSVTKEDELYNPYHGIDLSNVISKIIENGKTDYKIVYGDMANETEVYAATELQSFLYQTTGVTLPILEDGFVQANPQKLICVGNTSILENSGITIDYNALGTDGFVLKTEGTNLYIVGGLRGTLYGVYDWVEKILGVKFIASDCTYVPTLKEVPLYSMDVTEIPVFESRGYLAAVTSNDPVWYTRTRNNAEWNEAAGKYGGSVKWYVPISSSHNSLIYVKPDEYYKTEQDKKNNKHMFYVQNDSVVDICYTDGITEDGKLDETMSVSAAKVAIESLKTYVQDGSEDLYYMFGHMDTDNICSCDDCRKMADKYGKTGLYIRFANVLFDHVQRWANENLNGRKVKLVILGYALSEMPPVKYNTEKNTYEPIDETVIPRKEIMVRLAAITTNRYYTLNDEKQLDKWNDWFEKWGALSDNFMAWSYSAVHKHYFLYYPMKHTFVDYLKEFKEIGVKYMFVQGGHTELNDWQSIMDDYLFSKLLWNPNRDVNALVQEFVHYYFGELVEEDVMQFMRGFDTYYHLAQLEDSDALRGQIHMPTYNKYEYVNEGLTILNSCKEKVQNSDLSAEEKEIYLTRLDRVRLTPLYMLLINSAYYYTDKPVEKQKITNDFFETCDKLNVLEYGEALSIDLLKSKYGYNG